MLNLLSPKAEYAVKDGDIVINTDCFDLSQTLDCGQAFRFSCDKNIWHGVALGRLLEMEQTDNGIIIHNMSETEFLKNFYEYFTLDFDYASLINRLSQDKILKAATEFARGIRILKQDKWETICSFIISQNNNIPRIKGIVERLCSLYGNEIANEVYSFPTVETIADLSIDDLAPIRAGFRSKYIIDAAKKINSGEIKIDELEFLPIDESRKMLMQIKGVGPKVAECVLLFSCKRYEAFPLDVWIKRVMSTLYPSGLPECAKQYCGIAQQYLFHYARINKKDIF